MDLRKFFIYSSSTLLSHVIDDDELFVTSDDEDEANCNAEVAKIFLLSAKVPRISIRNFFEDTVFQYSDVEFITYFRLSRKVFAELSAQYENSSIFKNISHKYGVIAPDKTIAIFLWFCGHECESFRDMSNLFNISKSTVHHVLLRAISFISSLSSQVIVWPTHEKMIAEANHNQAKCGIPGVIGAVDGTKITIDPPSQHKDDYIDRKGNVTLSVQAVCNHEKKFTQVCIGFPGSAHDARVFRISELPEMLQNCPAGFRLLGDSAYPCLPALLVPYKDNGRLTEAHKLFNYKLSLCRVMIEHSFGILKQRFRQLYYCKLRGMKVLCHFIRACFVLHNLSDENEVEYFQSEINPQPESYQNSSSADSNSLADTRLSEEGKNIRNEICDLLWVNRRRRNE